MRIARDKPALLAAALAASLLAAACPVQAAGGGSRGTAGDGLGARAGTGGVAASGKPALHAALPDAAPPLPPAAGPAVPGGPGAPGAPGDGGGVLAGAGMEFVLVPAGSFIMGATYQRRERAMPGERYRHLVRITRPFWLGRFEVTQSQWEAVMGTNPSLSKGPWLPVESVSWHDVQVFLNRLNMLEGARGYRLPTEAEWEYAARAGGRPQIYFFGNDPSLLGGYAWYEGNSDDRTHPVGMKAPNAFGLYDIYGNVSEWVQDRYGDDYYGKSPASDPHGPSEGAFRVHRGCSWIGDEWNCRSASREPSLPGYRFNRLGLRVAFGPEE